MTIHESQIDFGGEGMQAVTRAWLAAEVEVLDDLLVDARETPIRDDEIDRHTAALLGNPRALAWLKDVRGIRRDTAVDFRLGIDGARLTIPVFDEGGRCCNLRKYLPGGKPKMLGLAGRRMRLYPWRAFTERTDRPFVACEGELDAVVGWQAGLRCLTSGGALTIAPWRRSLSRFVGEHIDILFDRDEAGQKGARKLAALLMPVAAKIRVLRIPLKHEGADITDWVLARRHGDAA